MRLTPFGERIPFLEIITFARKWLEWGVGISSWAIGTEQKVLNLKKQDKAYKLGSVICIESIFPSFVANFVSLGADFLVIITNDAWYDYTVGPEQHYDIARMRAIESRRYIARCANTGVSGFITAAGKTLVRAEQYKATGFIGYVPALKEKSLYVITGDVLPVISVSVTIALLLLSFHGLRKKCTEKTKPHPNPLQAEREII
jgi:apolipoprotein N-acyltransferase